MTEDAVIQPRVSGKHHQSGISGAQFFRMFPDDESARAWLEKARWPDGPRCPHCGSRNVQSDIKHPTMTHRCRACPNRRMFSVKLGTVMQASPIGYREWAIAIYLMCTSQTGVSSVKLHRNLGVSQKSTWFMLHRIREAYRTYEDGLFNGPIEADEAHFGGRPEQAGERLRSRLSLIHRMMVSGWNHRRTTSGKGANDESDR